MAEPRAGARIAGSLAAPLAGLAIVLVLGLGKALAAPSAELWERWLAHDPDSTITVDHGAWDRLIGCYLRPGPDGVDRFDYAAVDAADKAALAGYVDALAAIRPSALSRAEQLPYWINLYNALTVRVVLDHYPVETIRDIDISPGLFSNGPWGARLVTIEGEAVSLDDIEHRILRPIWNDPRLHYALNCAAVGCPQLHERAFTAEAAEAYLDAGARAYVNHPRGVSVTPRGVRLSKIYDWYRDDFADSDAALFAHLARYAEPALAEVLKGGPRILGYDYDWRLNDVE